MKEFYNDRLTKAIYNNYNNKRNIIFSGLCYEYDYEFADEIAKEKNEELLYLNKRQHKRETLPKINNNSKKETK